MQHISSLDEFRSHIAHKEEIREADVGDGQVSFCYMVGAADTFDSAWARECRGIVFDSSGGKVSARPLHKFFNVGERESTRLENIDWSRVTRVMLKRDGSMIHTVAVPGGFKVKSKKTFDSEVAQAATDWLQSAAGERCRELCASMCQLGCTAIFEWTAPDARIVINYDTPQLVLLHVRHNESGVYLDSQSLRAIVSIYDVPLVEEVDEFFDTRGVINHGWSVVTTKTFNPQRMLEEAATREGIEGWVVQFADGDMVKVKTRWYLERHRAMTFLRERDIAQLVLSEGLDDLKSLLVSEGVDISEIIRIENEVVEQLRNVRHFVEETIKNEGHRERKDFALEFSKTHAEFGWFGLLMTRYLGKEPDYKTWYERHVLKEKWSLRQLPMIQSIAEGE